MPVSEYLLSILAIFSGSLVWMVPVFYLSALFPRLPRILVASTYFGLLCFGTYLKPGFVPLCAVSLTLGISVVAWGWMRKVRPTLSFSLPIFGMAIYCFLLFFFRWEPPGGDPVKWGSLARLISETGLLPGDTRPLTNATELRGATLGIPILLAHPFALFGGMGVRLERLINFYSCLSLFGFVLWIVEFLSVWFSRKIASWTALLALVLFTVPQQYLAWGGTPTLVGFGFGLTWMWLWTRTEALTRGELVCVGAALAFAAYAHPIGVYISGLFAFPVLFFRWKPWRRRISESLWAFLFFLVGFSPFFQHFKMGVSAEEWRIVREWQRTMAGLLFRPDHSYLYNLYSHLTNVVWSTAAILSLLLLLMAARKRREWVGIAIAQTAVAAILVNNVRDWKLPLSFLLYPERVAGFWMLPLCLPLAFALASLSQRRIWGRAILFALVLLSLQQFRTRLLPYLGTSAWSPEDQLALETVARVVPREECVEIPEQGVGKWIPVVSFRCTNPFHGLSLSTVEEERHGISDMVRWYFQSSEAPPPERAELIFDRKIRIYHRPG